MTMITADPPPARPSRPTTVTVAFWLQLAAVLLLFALVGLVVWYAVYFDHLISEAAALFPDADPAEVSGERSSNVATAAVSGSVFLAGAVGLAATAWPLRQGSNGARVAVFVVSGLHVLACLLPCLLGAMIIPFVFAAPEPDVLEMPFEESPFYQTLYERTTGAEEAFFAGMSLGSLLEVLLVIALVVLIAVPPAHRYFVPRRPTPPWPAGAYPAAVPGQPWGAYAALVPGQQFGAYLAGSTGQPPAGGYPTPVPGQAFGVYPPGSPGQPPAGGWPAAPAPGHPYGGNPVPGQLYGGIPVPSQLYGGNPASGQSYGGNPASGQSYGGNPAEGQPSAVYPAPGSPSAVYPQPWAVPLPSFPYTICPDPFAHVPSTAETLPGTAAAPPAWPPSTTPGEPAAGAPRQMAVAVPGEASAGAPRETAVAVPGEASAGAPAAPATATPGEPSGGTRGEAAVVTRGEAAVVRSGEAAVVTPGETAAGAPAAAAGETTSEAAADPDAGRTGA